MTKLSRRKLLQRSAQLGLSALALSAAAGPIGLGAGFGARLCGCAGPVRAVPNRAYELTPPSPEPGRAWLGWYPSEPVAEVCERAVAALGGLPWLGHGDSVLIKVASNSPNEHPAVTLPEAVQAMARLLRAKGAGRVIVADQAGVEHVRRTATERKGSTREVMAQNGLQAAAQGAEAELVCFDDLGYEDFFRPAADFAHHWEDALWLPKVLQEVDHVVYMPRLGSHGVAGASLGAKIAVGFLRDDSRCHLHARGDTFFEQIAELSLFPALREKLRLTLTVARSALLKIGPDFGSTHDLGGVVAVGSARLFDHEALATALLCWLDAEDSSFFDVYRPYPEDADFWNHTLTVQVWGSEAEAGYRRLTPYPLGRRVALDRCLAHLGALERYRPSRIVVAQDGDGVPQDLRAYLRAQPDGLFAL